MYLEYTNEIPLPNQDLGLYAMNSFTFDLQVKEAAPRRSASTRLTRDQQPRYRGTDPIPKGPAYTSYASQDQPGSSHMYQTEHTCWEQPSPNQSKGSWQQDSSEQWNHENFDNYQQQHYEEVSSDHQGRRMSISGRGYHDQQMDHHRFDNRLTTTKSITPPYKTHCMNTHNGRR